MNTQDIALSGAIRRKDLDAMRLALKALEGRFERCLDCRHCNMRRICSCDCHDAPTRAAITALKERLLTE